MIASRTPYNRTARFEAWRSIQLGDGQIRAARSRSRTLPIQARLSVPGSPGSFPREGTRREQEHPEQEHDGGDGEIARRVVASHDMPHPDQRVAALGDDADWNDDGQIATDIRLSARHSCAPGGHAHTLA
jgi:hypothetical protein